MTYAVARFDPSVNEWFLLQNKPKAISYPSLVLLNNSIYCIEGYRDDNQVVSFCRFSPSSSEWVDLQPMGSRIYGISAVADDHNIFVIGGWSV